MGGVPGDSLSVVIVDDHALFSRGLELLINTTGGSAMKVVGRTDEAGAAVDLVRPPPNAPSSARWPPSCAGSAPPTG